MTTLSLSITYTNSYTIRSFISFDGNVIRDQLIESSDNSFLLSLIDRYDKIITFDSKQLLKYYIHRNINLSPEQILKVECLKLRHHLKDVNNNKNIEIPDLFNNYDLKNWNNRVKSFYKIYRKDRVFDMIPKYILDNYNIEIAKTMYDTDIKIDNEDYYNQLRLQLYSLGKCELNGIKITDNSISNIDGFIYPDYEYDTTSTGRLYNKYPVSLQNLSKEDIIKTKLVSRFKNGKILIADWNSIDLRVLFAMAGEHINTDDLHSDIAKIILEKEEITEEERKTIKEINFSIVYGAGLDSVSKKTGIEKEKLMILIQKLFVKFPKLKEFIIKTRSDILEKGYAESYFGRRRYLSKDDTTKFINSVIQQTSADICLRAIDDISVLFDYVNIETKIIPYIVYDKLAFDVDCRETEINYTRNLVTNTMSINAPGDLTKFVNFPIKIEIRETL